MAGIHKFFFVVAVVGVIVSTFWHPAIYFASFALGWLMPVVLLDWEI
jgi:hypothetical protein